MGGQEWESGEELEGGKREGRVTEGRHREKCPVGHGQSSSTLGASASMTQAPCWGLCPRWEFLEPRFLPSFR